MKSIILSAVFLLIIGCNNNAQKVNNNTQKTIPITDKYNLNSIIYKDVVLLKETLVKRFNYKEIQLALFCKKCVIGKAFVTLVINEYKLI